MGAEAGNPSRSRLRPGLYASLLAVLSGPILYPLWLLLATRQRSAEPPPAPESWPELLVVIPAYREEGVIAAKLEDLRANGYPGPLRLVVVAEDEGTAEAAAPHASVLRPSQRLGKSAALNHGFAEGREPIIAITDADARLAPGSLAKLVRWFEDPRVGAVAGEKQVRGGGQGLYWRFESWLKQREAERGTTIGLVGELAAFRRTAIRPLPADVVVDDLWLGLDVIESGARVGYEPEAVAIEEASPTLGVEWERRTRIQAGLLDLLVRRRDLLLPSRGGIAPELWGHKLVRAVAGPLAHLALLLRALRAAPRSLPAVAFVLVHLAAVRALAREQRGQSVGRLESVAGQLVFMQATALGGIVRYLRGDRPAVWPKRRR